MVYVIMYKTLHEKEMPLYGRRAKGSIVVQKKESYFFLNLERSNGNYIMYVQNHILNMQKNMKREVTNVQRAR